MLGTCLLRGWTVFPSLEVTNARLLGLFCVECRGGCRSARTCLLLFRSHDFGRTQNVLQCESCSLFNMYLLNVWGLSLALLDLFVRMHGRKVLRRDFCLWLVFQRGGFGRGGGRRCLGFFYLRTGSLVKLSRLVFRGPWGTCRGLCIFGLTVFFVCDHLEAIFISQGIGQLLFCHAP